VSELPPQPALSIIIPVLNEADHIVSALQELAPLRSRGAEIIVADGGSEDDTVALAEPLSDRVVTSARGRATQMNAGAAVARGDARVHLSDLLAADIAGQPIRVAGHCYGCTAGQGSSCGGALGEAAE